MHAIVKRSLQLANTWLVPLALAAGLLGLPAAQAQAGARPEVIGAYISRGLKDLDGAVEDFQELGAAGVNLVVDYRLAAPDADSEAQQAQWRRYMQAARENGIGISFYAGRYLFGADPKTAPAQMAKLVSVVERIKSEPAIVSWYMHDEALPSVNRGDDRYGYTLTLAQMLKLYQQVQAADPSRPQLAVWPELRDYEGFSKVSNASTFSHGRPDWASSKAAYEDMLRQMVRGVCDIPMLDVYPVGKPRPLGNAVYRKAVSSRLQRLADLKGPQQKLYFVFQSFSLKQNDPRKLADCEFPTVDEMNAMLGAAAEAGADGAIAYCWYNLANPIPSRKIEGVGQARLDLLSVFKGLHKRGWP
jgi:hypothetical protein